MGTINSKRITEHKTPCIILIWLPGVVPGAAAWDREESMRCQDVKKKKRQELSRLKGYCTLS